MAFVSSTFLGGRIRPPPQVPAARASPVQPPQALHKRRYRPEPDEPAFRPFDGSRPLLPAWRPPSVEADFSYTARRVVSRERAAPPARLVRVRSGYGTLFARVVQEVAGGAPRLWLRPLLLDGAGDEFVDLRGASDVVLEAGAAEDVSGELRARVDANLAATEADVVSRVVEDERWSEVGSRALLAFMQSLTGDGERE